MEYVIAVTASAWLVAFMLIEHRVGGRRGYLWRLVGSTPLVVMVALAWIGRFSYDAVMIVVVTVLVSTTVESALRWFARRAAAKRQAG
jgi:hypothetical protein